MVIRTEIERQSDGTHYAHVLTDSGGDQSFGPYRDEAAALDALKARLAEDFDCEFDARCHSTRVAGDPLA